MKQTQPDSPPPPPPTSSPGQTVGQVSADGGQIAIPGDRLSLTFAPHAVRNATAVTITHPDLPPATARSAASTAIAGGTGGLPFHIFEFNARPTSQSAARLQTLDTVTETVTFEEPVTLTYTYTPQEIEGINEATLHFVYLNPDSNKFEAIPSTVDAVAMQVTAVLTHFSTYGVAGDTFGWMTPSVAAFSVAEQRGQATYSYPIPVPTSAGGLAPQLTLNYNSGIVNGMVSDEKTDTGWVGIGWTLDTGQITSLKEDFSEIMVSFNGMSERGYRAADGVYHTRHQTQLRIERIDIQNELPAPSGCQFTNTSGAYRWKVTDQNGTAYYFGTEYSGGHPVHGSTLSYLHFVSSFGNSWNMRAYKLYRVEDVYGNRMEIGYEEIASNGCNLPVVSESYPQVITYTLNNNAGDTHGEYTVEFTTAAKGYNAAGNAKYGDGSKKLTQITTYYHPDATTKNEIRTITFNYTTDPTAKTNRLDSIQVSTSGQNLSPTTFTYADKTVSQHWQEYGDCSAHPNNCFWEGTNSWQRKFLIKAENGYGGRVEFTYQPAGACRYQPFQVVQQRKVVDDITGTPGQYSYGFSGCNIDFTDPSMYLLFDYNHFHGFNRVTTNDPAGNVTKRYFNNASEVLNGVARDGILNGRELERWFYGPGGTALYQAERTTWTAFDGAGWGWPTDVKFIAPTEKNSYRCNGLATDGSNNQGYLASCIRQRSTLEYNVQYGQLTRQMDYDANGSTVRRTTLWGYAHDAGYSIFKKAYEKIYRGGTMNTNTLVSSTWYTYDGHPTFDGVLGAETTTIQDDFSQKNTATWVYDSHQSVPYNLGGNNVVRNVGGGDWNADFYRTDYSLTDGEKMVVRFRVDNAGAYSVYAIEASDTPLHRFGINLNGGKIYVQYNDGSGWQFPKDLITDVQPNVWYVLEIEVDETNGFFVRVYPENNPAHSGSYQHAMPAGKQWRFHQWIHHNTAYLDNYREISFPAGKLTGVRRTEDGVSLIDTTFDYDLYGNPIRRTTYDDRGTITQYATQNPRATITEYDSQGVLPVTVTDPLSHIITTTYDYRWQKPLTETDANGKVTHYTYDNFGRLKTVKLPGETGAFTYRATYATGTSFGSSNPYHEQWTQHIETGDIDTYAFYDGFGRRIQTRSTGDTANSVIVNNIKYDALGRAIWQAEPYAGNDGSIATYWPPKNNAQTWGTQPKTSTTYDPLGRQSVVTSPDGAETHYYYAKDTGDSNVGNYTGTGLSLTAVKDANGHSKHLVYDLDGNLIRVREFTGVSYPAYNLYAETTYDYDILGNLTGVTDSAGNHTAITYNKLGQKTEMTDPDMGVWHYGYDNFNNLKWQQDARGQYLCFTYDKLNRLTGKSSGTDNTCNGNLPFATFTYDANGNRTTMTDAGGTVTYVYDARNRLTDETRTVNNGLGTYHTGYTYDNADRQKTITYPDGETVTTGYTPRGLPKTLTGNNTYIQSATYNVFGQPTARTAGNNLATQNSYNPLTGQLQRTQTGNLLNLGYAYDPVGNITALSDGSQNKTLIYNYDHLDRLVGYQNDSSPAKTITIRAKGSNADGWPQMQLRVNGVVIKEWTVSSGNWANYTASAPLTGNDQIDVVFTNDYNSAQYGDRNLWVDYVTVDGQTVQAEGSSTTIDRGAGIKAFDGQDVIAGQQGIYWNAALRFRVGHDTFYDAFTLKDGANWVYNSRQSIVNGTVKNNGTGNNWNANFYRKTYNLSDGEGLQVRFKVDRSDTVAHFSIEANDSTYRRFGVIASGGKIYVQYNDGSGWQYPKDLITNLQLNTWYVLTLKVDDSSAGFSADVYQENNPSVRGIYHGIMSAGKQWRFHHWIYRGNAYLDDYREFAFAPARTRNDYQYNQIGNLTQKPNLGTLQYTNTAHIHAVTNAGSNNYQYDTNGNMTHRTENGVQYTQIFNPENKLASVSWGNHTVTFTYDGDGERLLKTEDGVTTVYIGNYYEKTGSAVTKYYYFGGERVAMRDNFGVKYFHSDHLGSATLTTDSSGSPVHQIRYQPYGSERWHSGVDATDYDFTAQRLERGFGLLDYKARMYDATLGRFISADTIVPEYANPQDLNRYSYVRGNPVRFNDPSGHYADQAGVVSGGGFDVGLYIGVALAGASLTAIAPQAENITEKIIGGYQPTYRQGWVEGFTVGEQVDAGTYIEGPMLGEGIPPSIFVTPLSEEQDINTTEFPLDSGLELPTYLTANNSREPASEKTAKNMAKQIERDLGKEARREFHDMKMGRLDRTLNELREHARQLYEDAGKTPPKWMQ